MLQVRNTYLNDLKGSCHLIFALKITQINFPLFVIITLRKLFDALKDRGEI
jgi:hypothetical protein